MWPLQCEASHNTATYSGCVSRGGEDKWKSIIMLTMKQVDDRLGRLAGRYLSINESVQEMAVAIVDHANKTGDCDRARKLVRAVPAKMRSMLKNWFAEVSPINVTMGATAKDDTVSLRSEGKKKYMPFDIEKAKANVWYTDPFKKEPAPTLNTLQTYFDSVDRLFERMERDTKEDANKVEPEQIARVQALRAHLRAAYVEFVKDNPITTYDNLPEQEQEEEPNAAAAMAAAANG